MRKPRYNNNDVFTNTYPACEISKIIKNERDLTCLMNNNSFIGSINSVDINKKFISRTERIVSIGDVHGSYFYLLENLFKANITTAINKCEWKSQEIDINDINYYNRTVLIQVGDMVDRGPGTTESKNCLKHLQATANQFNSEVVRLIGSNNWH